MIHATFYECNFDVYISSRFDLDFKNIVYYVVAILLSMLFGLKHFVQNILRF